ncbi:MAG: hypothetical protein ACT443_12180 [Gemmatimonadota bacterium]
MAAPACAQRAPVRFESAQDTVREVRGWSVTRVAKWSTLVASAGAATYGFTQNRAADREYEQIERLCEATPNACMRGPDDAYADAALEARYQNVLRRDDRAQLALLAGQIGLILSVLLFIVDLPEGTTPDDIPYDPRPLRLGVRADQLELGIQLPVR